MKKIIASIAAIFAIALLAPVAQAGHTQRRVVAYNQCGDAVYATWRVVSYQRCGTPNYSWVRDNYSAGCTRSGRCNHHGHSHCRTQTSYRNSRQQSAYTSPRVGIRTQAIGRGSYRSSSYRSSGRSRSCR